MKTAIVGGRLITPERIIDDGILCLEDGKISGIVRGEVPEGAKVIHAGGNYVSPGFIDLHTHGGGGHDFMDGTAEAVEGACRAHLVHGTTSLCPTTLTSTDEELFTFFDCYREAKKHM